MTRDRWRRFVFEEYRTTPESLAIYRLVFAAWLLAFRVPRYVWIGEFPDSFFNPPLGPTVLFFSGFPPSWFFVALDVTVILALVYLLAGRRVTLASLLLTASLLGGNAWAFSFGKINHEILLVLAPLFLVAAGWDGRGPVRAWPLALFALVIAVTMLTAAVAKLTTGWLDPSNSATFGHAVANAIGLESRDTAAFRMALRTLPRVAWEGMDYAAVLLEASFVFAVFRRQAFRVCCALACLFHLGVAMLMRIMFTNVYAYGAFVQWDTVAARCRIDGQLARLQHWLSRRTDRQLLVSGLAFAAIALLWRNPLAWLWSSVIRVNSSLVLTWMAALGGGIFLLGQLRRRPARVDPLARTPVILFDGVCGLCNLWVDLILRLDHHGLFRFAPLQSATGQAYLLELGLPPDYDASIVLIADRRMHVKSSAILAILQGLGGPWRLLGVCRVVPAFMRDWIYDAVAIRRYRWFGRRDVCRMPTPAERSRFL